MFANLRQTYCPEIPFRSDKNAQFIEDGNNPVYRATYCV